MLEKRCLVGIRHLVLIQEADDCVQGIALLLDQMSLDPSDHIGIAAGSDG